MADARQGALRTDDSGLAFRRRSLRRVTLLMGALCALALSGAASRAASLTDSVNRTVEVAVGVKAVVPAGPPAQILLHALAPDKLAGLVEPFRPEHAIYVDPKIAQLPQIPMLARTSKPGDVRMIADLEPGLVVDYGNASKRYAEADAKIEKELGVPTVLFGGSLGDAARVARAIGAAIGESQRGEAIAATVGDILGRVKPLTDLGDAERVPVYLARGKEGLLGARSGTSFDEPIRLAGGRNVVEAGNGTFKRMSVEEIVALKPAVVIIEDRDAMRSRLHDALPKETRYVLDAGEPYKVLTGAPSINRLAGVAALAVLLHPDKMKMDPEDITRIETKLFPIPPGLALPAPLQVITQ